jgi:hypothetical protein
MRIIFHDTAIHECTRIAFISVTDDVFMFILRFGHGRPFETGGITGAAASAQPASGDLLDHFGRGHL